MPSWQRAIYTVDNTSTALHTPKNKGKESLAYLTYLVDNYPDFPETVAFVHSHRDGYPKAWHNDADNYDNVKSLRSLKLDFVQKNGYANLRCNWVPGCPSEIEIQNPVKGDEKKAEQRRAMIEGWSNIFNNTAVPPMFGVACCSQFAVSRSQVLKRTLTEYKSMQNWVLTTNSTDAMSGRVMEYLWHVVFGQDAV